MHNTTKAQVDTGTWKWLRCTKPTGPVLRKSLPDAPTHTRSSTGELAHGARVTPTSGHGRAGIGDASQRVPSDATRLEAVMERRPNLAGRGSGAWR